MKSHENTDGEEALGERGYRKFNTQLINLENLYIG
jgi:hypothetical protein